MVAPFRRIYAGEEEIPEEQDWVEKGHVTEIKAQVRRTFFGWLNYFSSQEKIGKYFTEG